MHPTDPVAIDRPVALVTGVGRSIGIGAAVARRLSADGWDLAANFHADYDKRVHAVDDRLGREEIQREVEAAGACYLSVDADLGDLSAAHKLFDDVEGFMGRSVTALVMCHCESVDSGLLDTTVESFDRHYAINVRATWLLVREFALRFQHQGRSGRIIAMTSDHTVGNLPYGATKGAQDRLVLAAARELADRRVTANVINPGPTDTDWMSSTLKAEITAATPLARLGRPDDAANLVSFLCSEQGDWINGQLLVSDGGVSA